jgi:hypothetical protein
MVVVAAVVVFAAGAVLGLGAGEGDFFVAADTVSGAHNAKAARNRVIVCNLFFMVEWVPNLGPPEIREFRAGMANFRSAVLAS